MFWTLGLLLLILLKKLQIKLDNLVKSLNSALESSKIIEWGKVFNPLMRGNQEVVTGGKEI